MKTESKISRWPLLVWLAVMALVLHSVCPSLLPQASQGTEKPNATPANQLFTSSAKQGEHTAPAISPSPAKDDASEPSVIAPDDPPEIRATKRMLAIKERVLGLDHRAVADSLYDLVLLYCRIEKWDEALPFAERAVQIRQKALEPDHPDLAKSLNDLATIYDRLGQDVKAEALDLQALGIWEKNLRPGHGEILMSLSNLAGLYERRGDFAKAAEYYRRAVDFVETRPLLDAPKLPSMFLALAGFYRTIGDYPKAKRMCEKAIEMDRRMYGKDSIDEGGALSHLASIIADMGDYAEAESLQKRTLRIYEGVLGPGHRETAVAQANLAFIYRSIGDATKAVELYQKALQVLERDPGYKQFRLDWALHNLAVAYADAGDHNKAIQLFERSLAIKAANWGVDSPQTYPQIISLGALNREIKNYGKAQELLERGKTIIEKACGTNSFNSVFSLSLLALLNQDLGEYSVAWALYQRVFGILDNSSVSDGPLRADIYDRASELLIALEKKREAVAAAARAQQIRIGLLANIFSFTSERQRLNAQGKFNPHTVFATVGAAPEVALSMFRFKGAVLDSLVEDRLVARLGLSREDQILFDHLRATKQRLSWVLLEFPKDAGPEAREKRETEKRTLASEVERLESELARHVTGLGRARRALSVTVEQVQKAIPKQAALVELLRYMHYLGADQREARYGAVVLASTGEPRWVPLGSAEAIEKNISSYQAAVRTGPKSEVQSPKPAGSANPKSEVRNQKSEVFSTLLQALYQQLWAPIEAALPKGTKTVIISPDGSLNFVSYATLLTPENQFLGQKYSLRYVSSGRDLLKEKKPSPSKRVTIYANPDFGRKGAERLQDQTGRSAGPSLVGTDGLPKPRESVAQEGRSLRESRSTPSLTNSGAGGGKEVRDAVERVLTKRGEDPAPLRYLDRRDLQDLRLEPLPGTAKEGAALTAQAKTWDWPAAVFVGAEASEAHLQTIDSPRILHLATHGFFLPDVGENGKEGGRELRGVGGVRPNFEPSPTGSIGGGSFGSGMESAFSRPVALKNPMHRSGLALAGAQATLDAWKRGETPPTSNDGIVTADEVGTLKLEGTELVVLSACDTGIGAIKSGEGVLGLRRGFIQAGAENLLMTLWSVADEETARIMTDFYERFHATGNAPQALAEVQRDWLVKLRKQLGIERAVSLAGPFILSSQGQ